MTTPSAPTQLTSLVARRAPGAVGVLVEAGVVAVALLANLVVRRLTLDDLDTAVAHAHALLDLEQRLHLDWEHGAQVLVEQAPWLATAASWFYFWGYLPVVALALVVLFVVSPHGYAYLRNALLAGGIAGLPVYLFYPLAPPRLTGLGYADPVASSLVEDPSRPVGVANEIGAMPSFHIAYLVVVSVAVWRLTRSRWVRTWCVLHPLAMSWVVLATGNHWVLDLPAGLLLAVVGLGTAEALAGRMHSATAGTGLVRDLDPEGGSPR